MYMTVQQRDIAIPHKPFRMGFKCCPVNAVNDTQCAVATFGKKNSFYFLVIQHLLKVS
jgi:hypothetical protein